MHGFEFLDELVLLSLAAVVVILAFNRIKLPPIIGLIATGLILGPTGFDIVKQGEIVSTISELGVVMLLFTIGLEFSLTDLVRLRKIVLVAGPLQVVVSAIVIGIGSFAVSTWTGMGLTIQGAILIGISTAISSTAICTKILEQRRELGLSHGRAVLGLLISQDIAVVPLMVVVTLLAPGGTVTAVEVLIRMLTLVAVTGGLIVGLRFALPRLIPYVLKVSTPEVLILGGLALCLGTAYLTSLAGLSMALGGFIAGVAIAGSEGGHAIGRALQPMQDAFTSMFFLSVGLLVNISWEWLPMNVITALAILLAKAAIVIAILLLIRIRVRTAVMAGIILAQVGEFSFVLAGAGLSYGVINSFDFQNMLVTIIITMIVTPALITIAPRFAERASPMLTFVPLVSRWMANASDAEIVIPGLRSGADSPTVVIAGGGVLGQNVARVLNQTGIPNTILELSGEYVDQMRKDGHRVVQGDATDIGTLKRAGIGSASVIIVAISDQTAIAHVVAAVRKQRPDAFIVARTRYARDSEGVANRGADVVITEEYESSIQVFVTVLHHLGLEESIIESQEDAMRAERYGLLGKLQRPAPKTESTG